MLTLAPKKETNAYFTCFDCGVRFKVNTTNSSVKPKYCKVCSNSKRKN